MGNGIIVVQAGAIKKDGLIHVPSHWSCILRAYSEVACGTKLICREEERLRNMQTLPVPAGLEPILLPKMDGLKGKVKGYIFAASTINELVAEADFVGTVLPSNLGNLAVTAAKKYNKPLFFEYAGESKFYGRKISLKLPFQYGAYLYCRHIDVKANRYADLAMYVSGYLQEISGRTGRPSAVVPHTTIFDKDIFYREDTCRGTEIRIFSANRIVREKGLQNLLAAIHRLRDDGFNIKATLAGDGDYLVELKRQCSHLKLDDVITFPGHINVGPDLWQFYRQADIMVLPSMAEYEGTPKTIIEAMASSCPVVASAIGGVTVLLEESGCGRLVEPGDVEDLITGLKTVIHNNDLRRQYIADGREWVRNVTLERRTEKIRELLSKYLPAALKR